MPDTNKKTYEVLARKYRSQSFKDLIGQEVLTKTLINAIEKDRVSHAYIFTGIRGTGKTSTARILAKCLNCIGPDGQNKTPTVEPCGKCEHCRAITESRHVDVYEIDAASHTGVDDVREILENIQYKPTSARYKIYIIDEVHMLSNSAFNALLKTLEEPPEHIKFFFATTEIRKVPATILSRCQRFSLSRIDAEKLKEHIKMIAENENAKIEEDAAVTIAKSAEGSARDAISILDQAIVNGNGEVTTDLVSKMLGLSDQSILLDLFESIINANIQTSLEIIEKFNKNGADPSLILKDLLNICYWIMRIKVINSSIEKLPFANSEKSRFEDLSKKLTIPTLSRIWQLLFKGLNETNTAPNPEQTLEVIIIRTAHSSSIPLPHELIKQINQNNSEDPENKKKIKTEESTLPASSFQQTSPASSLKPQNIIELFEILRENKEILLIKEIEDNLIIHEFQYGQISLSQKDAKRKTDQKLKKILNNITKINWKLDIILFDKTHQTINDKKEEETKNLEKDLKNNPLIKILFETFDNLTIDKIESINNNKTN